MSLIRWDPFKDFRPFFEDDWGLVPMVKGDRGFGMPALDVYQTDTDVVAEVGVPAGVDPEKIDISIEGDTLTVRGETEEEHETKEKHYYRKEIRKGAFERSIMLPAAVKTGEAEAHYERGVLKITMPKAEESKVKRVEVKIKK